MARKNAALRLVICETVGFVILITLAWLNELVGLPALLFGGPASGNWHEAAMETAVILIVALPTVLLTFGFSKRLFYLEGFLRVCAWCGNVAVDNGWIPMQHFVTRELNAKTSHGMCPECASKFRQKN